MRCQFGTRKKVRRWTLLTAAVTDEPWLEKRSTARVVVLVKMYTTVSPTNDSGACSANAEAAADSSRCWWTCGGCTRDTDITTCPDKLTWGLTYDDGPAFYTPNLLQVSSSQNISLVLFPKLTKNGNFLNTPKHKLWC